MSACGKAALQTQKRKTVNPGILRAFLFFLFLLCGGKSWSQSYKAFDWEGGVFLGGANYSGDINPAPGPRMGDTRLSLGVSGRIQWSPKWWLRTNFAYGRLRGDDLDFPQRQDRGYRFSSNVIDLTLIAEYEPLGRDRFYVNKTGDVVMDRLLSPYAMAGFGFVYMNIERDFSRMADKGVQDKISADLRKGSALLSPVFPIGVGVKYDLDTRYTLAAEAGFRVPFSDYIDGISQAASPRANDVYMFSGLFLYYRF